jgi:pyridoxamine 5'-phosphate oxidase
MSLLSEQLRALKSLAGPFPAFDPAVVPEEPRALFAAWLQQAIAADVQEAHAMTLSTVDDEGCPDARVLILKDMDHDGWHFATGRLSRKGRHIGSNPRAALTFYWQSLGRQVRLRGRVRDLGIAARDADFRAKPLGSRAAALLARQSGVLSGDDELDRALGRERARVAEEPGIVAPDWVVYALDPAEVEFWQGDGQRRHIRLRYRRHGAAWCRERLWP